MNTTIMISEINREKLFKLKCRFKARNYNDVISKIIKSYSL